MAATCLSLRPSSSSSFIATHNTRASPSMSKSHVHVSLYSPSLRRSIQLRYPPNRTARISIAMAVVDGEAMVADKEPMDDYNYDYDYLSRDDDDNGPAQWKNQSKPCELYVCNLPRSCDIPDLMDMFKPFGTVISVEISRNPETGVSKGCGYVTVGSMAVAKAAIAGLDASDVGGREMRVRFSVHMNTKRRNNATSSTPVKSLIYESPHKVYVGNLAWAVQPEELRNHFSQFGTVTSARVLHDRKAGTTRAYGFLSFSSAAERDSAMSLDGTEFSGRQIVVREGTEKH